MNGQDEPGFTVHFGCLVLGVLATLGAVVILFTLGWRRLWLVPAGVVALGAGLVVLDLVESRWRAVTPEHVRRGVPPCCPECHEEWSVIARKKSYKTRCPICGHRGRGVLSPPG